MGSVQPLIEILESMILDFVTKRPHIINNVYRELIDKQELEKEVRNYISGKAQGMNLSAEEIEWLIFNFKIYTQGWGVLQPLIDDRELTDIKVISYDNIRVKRNGKRQKADIQFASPDSLKRFVNMIAVRNGGSISEMNALQKLTDAKSCKYFILRINIAGEYVNSVNHQYLTIRKISKEKLGIEDLQMKGMFDSRICKYLYEAIRNDFSILVTGKGASGKTTLINALIDEIPHDKSALVIQEAEELFSDTHPDMMFQTVRYTKGESKIRYTLRDLSINGLLTDLDYFVIGEIKGEEAMDMINAIYTGHAGITSVHGNNAEESLDKIVHYMKYVSDLKKEDLMKMLSGLDVIIYMKNFMIIEITEIICFDEGQNKLLFNKVFKFQSQEDSTAFPDFQFVRLNESCAKAKEKLRMGKYYRQNNSDEDGGNFA